MSYRIRRGLFPSGAAYSKRIQEFSGNLVAHWPLNERSGTVAYDLSGNGNDGAITGATLGQAGIGDGLTSQGFDGATSFIDISAIASDLMLNGGFETAGAGDPDFWADWLESAGDGALANEGAVIHTGADAAKLTSGVTRNTYIRQPGTVVPGETYKLRFWARGDGTHDGRYRIYDNTNAADIVALAATGVTAAAYSKIDVDFTAPASCVQVSIRFYCSATAAHDSYFDTTSLRRTDIPTFDPHEGSILAWAKITNWADGVAGYLLYLSADANNYMLVRKAAANNQVDFIYDANAVIESQAATALTYSGLTPYGITWSLSGDKVIYYIGGVQVGATDTTLGVFTGNLGAAATVLGASATVPSNVFDGNLAHGILSNTAWDADEMKYLMSLP